MVNDAALEDFLSEMVHALDSNNTREGTHVTAFKIDDADGIACKLGFHAAMISKVDYFRIKGERIQLIELSDMDTCATSCLENKKIAVAREAAHQGIPESQLPRRIIARLRREAWSSVVNEFNRKWSGSIAVIERLYRKNGILDDNPEYKMLVICKDSTDTRVLDDLLTLLTGMMGDVKACNSSMTSEFILK